MAKVPQEARQSGKPQLAPKVCGGAEIVVVTIASVEWRKSSFKNANQPVLTFEEFPEHELRVGKRGTDRLCQQLGDDDADWIGGRVPLAKNREEVGTNTYIVYQIAPVEEWAALLKANKAATKKSRRGATA